MDLSTRKSKLRKRLRKEIAFRQPDPISLGELDQFVSLGSIWGSFVPCGFEPPMIHSPDGIRFCFPRITDSAKSKMEFFFPTEGLKEGAFPGLFEPQGNDLVSPENVAVMLIPGEAFDFKGCRLGKGKGYYDRYLKDFKGLKIGICAKERLLDEPLPMAEHDVPMDFVLTENYLFQPVRRRKVG